MLEGKKKQFGFGLEQSCATGPSMGFVKTIGLRPRSVVRDWTSDQFCGKIVWFRPRLVVLDLITDVDNR